MSNLTDNNFIEIFTNRNLYYLSGLCVLLCVLAILIVMMINLYQIKKRISKMCRHNADIINIHYSDRTDCSNEKNKENILYVKDEITNIGSSSDNYKKSGNSNNNKKKPILDSQTSNLTPKGSKHNMTSAVNIVKQAPPVPSKEPSIIGSVRNDTFPELKPDFNGGLFAKNDIIDKASLSKLSKVSIAYSTNLNEKEGNSKPSIVISDYSKDSLSSNPNEVEASARNSILSDKKTEEKTPLIHSKVSINSGNQVPHSSASEIEAQPNNLSIYANTIYSNLEFKPQAASTKSSESEIKQKDAEKTPSIYLNASKKYSALFYSDIESRSSLASAKTASSSITNRGIKKEPTLLPSIYANASVNSGDQILAERKSSIASTSLKSVIQEQAPLTQNTSVPSMNSKTSENQITTEKKSSIASASQRSEIKGNLVTENNSTPSIYAKASVNSGDIILPEKKSSINSAILRSEIQGNLVTENNSTPLLMSKTSISPTYEALKKPSSIAIISLKSEIQVNDENKSVTSKDSTTSGIAQPSAKDLWGKAVSELSQKLSIDSSKLSQNESSLSAKDDDNNKSLIYLSKNNSNTSVQTVIKADELIKDSSNSIIKDNHSKISSKNNSELQAIDEKISTEIIPSVKSSQNIPVTDSKKYFDEIVRIQSVSTTQSASLNSFKVNASDNDSLAEIIVTGESEKLEQKPSLHVTASRVISIEAVPKENVTSLVNIISATSQQQQSFVEIVQKSESRKSNLLGNGTSASVINESTFESVSNKDEFPMQFEKISLKTSSESLKSKESIEIIIDDNKETSDSKERALSQGSESSVIQAEIDSKSSAQVLMDNLDKVMAERELTDVTKMLDKGPISLSETSDQTAKGVEISKDDVELAANIRLANEDDAITEQKMKLLRKSSLKVGELKQTGTFKLKSFKRQTRPLGNDEDVQEPNAFNDLIRLKSGSLHSDNLVQDDSGELLNQQAKDKNPRARLPVKNAVIMMTRESEDYIMNTIYREPHEFK